MFWIGHISKKQSLYYSNRWYIRCFIWFPSRKYNLVQAHQAYADKVLNNQSTPCTTFSFPKEDSTEPIKISQPSTCKCILPGKVRGTCRHVFFTRWRENPKETEPALKHAFWKLSDTNEQNNQHHRPISLYSGNKREALVRNLKLNGSFLGCFQCFQEKDLGQDWIGNGPKGYPWKIIPMEISEYVCVCV